MYDKKRRTQSSPVLGLNVTPPKFGRVKAHMSLGCYFGTQHKVQGAFSLQPFRINFIIKKH